MGPNQLRTCVCVCVCVCNISMSPAKEKQAPQIAVDSSSQCTKLPTSWRWQHWVRHSTGGLDSLTNRNPAHGQRLADGQAGQQNLGPPPQGLALIFIPTGGDPSLLDPLPSSPGPLPPSPLPPPLKQVPAPPPPPPPPPPPNPASQGACAPQPRGCQRSWGPRRATHGSVCTGDPPPSSAPVDPAVAEDRPPCLQPRGGGSHPPTRRVGPVGVGPCLLGTRGQGFFRIIKNQGGGVPLPQNPLPPSPDQSDHRGKKRNLQSGKSGQAIFGTPSFGSKPPSPLPPPPPPRSKEALHGVRSVPGVWRTSGGVCLMCSAQTAQRTGAVHKVPCALCTPHSVLCLAPPPPPARVSMCRPRQRVGCGAPHCATRRCPRAAARHCPSAHPPFVLKPGRVHGHEQVMYINGQSARSTGGLCSGAQCLLHHVLLSPKGVH